MNTLNYLSLRILVELQRRQQVGALPPTVCELMPLVGDASTGGTFARLYRLREFGLVTWELGKERTLRLTCRLEAA